jgi:large subunit ribosomal protein L4
LRSPVWRHGGSVFGPKPRSYAIDLPRKKYRTALQSALSAKVAEGSVVVLSDLVLDQPKTKSLAKILGQLGITGSAILVVGASRADLFQAARNLSKVKVVHPEQLTVYDIVRVHSLVITERELERVKEVWS